MTEVSNVYLRTVFRNTTDDVTDTLCSFSGEKVITCKVISKLCKSQNDLCISYGLYVTEVNVVNGCSNKMLPHSLQICIQPIPFHHNIMQSKKSIYTVQCLTFLLETVVCHCSLYCILS